jgi:7,8-didemethyl-8-hydroxy-5-deazariboflavin synthase CofH subunit
MSLERLISGISPVVADVLDRALQGRELSVDDAERLLQVQGRDLLALMGAADLARQDDKGDIVTFVICRNMNFTNICYTGCTYCGFSRHKDDPDAFDYPMEVLIEKGRDAVARGATEFCIQGGIHPNKNHTHYHEIVTTLKREFPQVHLHAFSPEEVDYGHRASGMSLEAYLSWLRDAGLGTIPGTAAEILDDEVRRIIEPRKLNTARWVEIVKTAHRVGLRSTATVMYGHVEQPRHVAAHLGLIRDIQKETGGFTEFVPLGYIHERNRLYNHLGARPGSNTPEDVRVVSVARLLLRPWIRNIQMSWVKMGTKLAQMALLAGANDFGGTLMEESISRESGADHGENLPAEEMRRLIREMGRIPAERSTKYEILRVFEDPSKDPPSFEPEHRRELSGPRRFREARGVASSPRVGATSPLLQIDGVR